MFYYFLVLCDISGVEVYKKNLELRVPLSFVYY